MYALIYLSRSSSIASSYLMFVVFGLASKVHSSGLVVLDAGASWLSQFADIKDHIFEKPPFLSPSFLHSFIS